MVGPARPVEWEALFYAVTLYCGCMAERKRQPIVRVGWAARETLRLTPEALQLAVAIHALSGCQAVPQLTI